MVDDVRTDSIDRRTHWDDVFKAKGERVSWHEMLPVQSLALLDHAGLTRETCVIDVGGGDSRLVDALLARGLDCLAVLDVSDEALGRVKARLGTQVPVTWIAADVTSPWVLKPVDIWHDRAVFHFLTTRHERAMYVARLADALKPGGSAIIATFGLDGPEACSGLPVIRYSPESLAVELGQTFRLTEAVTHRHRTPWGAVQSFQYSRFTYLS